MQGVKRSTRPPDFLTLKLTQSQKGKGQRRSQSQVHGTLASDLPRALNKNTDSEPLPRPVGRIGVEPEDLDTGRDPGPLSSCLTPPLMSQEELGKGVKKEIPPFAKIPRVFVSLHIWPWKPHGVLKYGPFPHSGPVSSLCGESEWTPSPLGRTSCQGPAGLPGFWLGRGVG